MPASLHLRRTVPHPVAGLLLQSTDASCLRDTCARLPIETLPQIFLVPGGFLIRAEESPKEPLPAVLKLREVVANLFLPFDAELLPALHPCEAEDLAKQHGLIILPHRILRYDFRAPLSADNLLVFPNLRRPAPRSLSEGKRLMPSIRRLELQLPPGPPELLLDPGGNPLRDEETRPPTTGNPIRRSLGSLSLGLGRFLSGLGTTLGIGGLARLGGRLAETGMNLVPRLSEQVFGKQEAALRDLLRRFREGDIEGALRRALPVGGDGGRGGSAAGNAILPHHSLTYSLAGLLGSSGPASVWYGGMNVMGELMAEYRRAAANALAAGDFRRAAYIYAKLLSDYRAAADVLARGGLHRDAALIYRDKLHDLAAAARCFSAAEDFEEALRLYRLLGDHLAAGDLLHRLGEEESALAEWTIAAEAIVAKRCDCVAAGRLILGKSGRQDLATAYFQRGWQRRNDSVNFSSNAQGCAEALLVSYTQTGESAAIQTLVSEMEAWLGPRPQLHRAADWYTLLLKASEDDKLAAIRWDLRDAVRLGQAARLREYVAAERRPGTVIAQLFSGWNGLSPSFIGDAEFALKAALRSTEAVPNDERSVNTCTVLNASVTAARYAPESEELFLGGTNGKVVCFRASDGAVDPILEVKSPILALACGGDGNYIVALTDLEKPRLVNAVRGNDGRFQEFNQRDLPTLLQGDFPILSPTFLRERRQVRYEFCRVAAAGTYHAFMARGLFHNQRLTTSAPSPEPQLSVPLHELGPLGSASVLLILNDRTLIGESPERDLVRRDLPWSADWGTASIHPLAWLKTATDACELAGIDREGVLHWTPITVEGTQLRFERTLVSRRPGGYRGVCFVRPGRLAGVTAENRVCWLRAGSSGFEEWATGRTIWTPSTATACFFSERLQAVLVVCADGTVAQVPVAA